MTDRQDPDEDFRRIIESNTWDDVPADHDDHEPWAEDIPWQPHAQPPTEIPVELQETAEDEAYDPDPGTLTQGLSPDMVRALTVIVAVLTVLVGLALLPGALPTVVWAAGVAGVVGGLYLVFRALPEDPSGDDGAVV